MAQIILIEDNHPLFDLLSINLKTYLGAELIPRKNAADAIDLLNILPQVSLVITKNKIDKEDSAQLIWQHLRQSNLDTGLIVIGDCNDKIKEDAVVINDHHEWEKVIKASAKILGVDQQMLSKKILPDYIPIPVRNFLVMESTCCDVFIRIKKGPDNYQFIKRLRSGENYSRNTITRYIEQGLEDFFIPKEFQKNFTNHLSNILVSKLESIEEVPTFEEKIETINASYEIALSQIKNFGFTSATIQLTDSVVSSITKTFQDSPQISTLLHKIINSKSGHMYQRCHLKSIVAAECINALQEDIQDRQVKLTYAAFFNDILFVENEELLKINSYEALERAQLDEEKWDLVFNHALEAATLFGKHPEAPYGVETIIREHHGALNGKGFPTSHDPRIHILSKVFIIAESFVEEMFTYKKSAEKPAPIIKTLLKKFADQKEILVIIKSLEKLLKDKAKKAKKAAT